MRLAPLLIALATAAVAPPLSAFAWPNAAERVEKQLTSGDLVARRKAASQLSELPDVVARRLALRALADPDPEVRLAAVSVALSTGAPGASERVGGWLTDPDRRLRLAAAELLTKMPSVRALPALGRALSDTDPAVRSAAAAALGASGSADAVLPLLGHLDDSVPAVRATVVAALARLGDRRAVVPLIGKIQDSRPPVRRAVARALGELADGRATSALLLALRDPDESVQIAAVEALGRLSDASSVLPVSALVDENPRSMLRAAALSALARIGTPEAVERVVRALEVEDAHAPEGDARSALAAMGPAAVPRLERCLSGQPAANVADGCALALGEIGERRSAPAVRDALRRGVVRPRAALTALGKLGDAKSLPHVLEHLSAPDATVRRAAVDAADALLDPAKPDGRAVDPIARALDAARSSHAERLALIELLGRTGAARAAAVLTPIAESADVEVLRVAALSALGLLGKGNDRVLLSALDAPEPDVRRAAAVALWRTAGGASARVLLDRLERAAEQDRAALALALAGALAHSKDALDLDRALSLLAASRGGERDALIEAAASFPARVAVTRLSTLAQTAADVADRAQIAEALAHRTDARELLRRLSTDVDGSVRANAVWALGRVGGAADATLLTTALGDGDVAVAANAAQALGVLGAREKTRVAPALCRALGDSRSALRSAALTGLSLASARCDGAADERALSDRSALVRASAAQLLVQVRSKAPDRDRELLSRCAAEDRDGAVAARCAAAKSPAIVGREPVQIFVVPLGETAPLPRAPFALELADGSTRYGLTDRRGQVLERQAPRGAVRLGMPAPLVE